jgi:hypothetical protein
MLEITEDGSFGYIVPGRLGASSTAFDFFYAVRRAAEFVQRAEERKLVRV